MAGKRSNVLITGGTGFLGHYIVNAFKTKGYYVSTLSRSDKADLKIDIANDNFKINDKFDIIVHSAGLAHRVPKNKKEKNLFFEINVRGTMNLLKNFHYTPKHFIFISSISVYGLGHAIDVDENTELNAKDPYGKSKIEAEKLLTRWSNKNDVTLTILRLPLLFGKEPLGNLEAMIRAIKKGYYFDIGKGSTRKSGVLSEDVALFCLDIYNQGGIYNLTDGHNPSFRELSTLIASKYKKPKPIAINYYLVKTCALIFGFIEYIFNVSMPLNLKKFDKITHTLTLNDYKARSVGWKPKKIIENPLKWLG